MRGVVAPPSRRRRAKPAGPVPAIRQDASDAAPVRRRVLVALGRSGLRDAVQGTLARAGLDVRRTSHPEHLVASVRRFRPAVVVLDDRLGRSGHTSSTLVPMLGERFPGLRVIVVSGDARTARGGTDDPVERGAWDVVRKGDILAPQGGHALLGSVLSALAG